MTKPGEFRYRRIHKASRELLFDCMTQPEHLSQFWGPDGTTTPADDTKQSVQHGTERDGYSYEVKCAEGTDFSIVARHAPAPPDSPIRYPILAIDQNMQVGEVQ